MTRANSAMNGEEERFFDGSLFTRDRSRASNVAVAISTITFFFFANIEKITHREDRSIVAK